jgi:hypothetical protein
VDKTSSPSKSPDTWVSPFANAPKIIARCEIDLSPGIWGVPAKVRALFDCAIGILKSKKIRFSSRSNLDE